MGIEFRMATVLYSTFLSLLFNLIFKSISVRYKIFLDKVDENKPQKFHKHPVPRIGGLGIFLSFLVFSLYSFFRGEILFFVLILVVSLSVFLIGIYEDYRGNVPPKVRILFMVIGGVLAVYILDAVILSVGFFQLNLFIAVPFTIFAIVGLTNAINMIDGFNGLASGISLFAFIAFAYVLNTFGDIHILGLCLLFAGGILGFLILNFPFGKIFLGDGGAYLIGFILALVSILMVKKYPEISPWFPVVILAYPIFDVLFAIFRRKFIHGTSPFSPDKYHLHSLIYKKLTKNNPLTSVVVLLMVTPFNLFALAFMDNTYVLFTEFLIFCLCYLIFYYMLGKDFFRRKVTNG